MVAVDDAELVGGGGDTAEGAVNFHLGHVGRVAVEVELHEGTAEGHGGSADCADGAGIEDDIADILHAGGVHDHALEAEAVAAVGDGAEFAEIQIVTVGGEVHAAFLHFCDQLIVVGLTLGAADDLADTGDEQVGGGNGLAVGVLFHIEGLDVLRVVDDKDRLVENLLGQVALVLGLEVNAPLHWELEVHGGLLEEFNGLGVVEDLEVVVDDVVEFLQEALLNALVEELHLLGAALQSLGDDGLHHFLGDFQDIRELGKGDFRLHMPELSHVALGVGVLGAERRAERVDLAESHGGDFALQLAGYREAGLLAEKVVLVVLLFGLALLGGIVALSRDLKHFAGTLGVGTGDERGVDVDETVALEVLMDGGGKGGADVEHGVERVGAYAQLRHGAEILHGVALLLERVVRGAGAEERDLLGVDLHATLFVDGGRDDSADDLQRGTEGEAGLEVRVCKVVLVDDDLQMLECGAVVELGKGHGLRVTGCPDPSADGDVLLQIGRVGHDIFDIDVFHENSSANFVLI